MPDPAQLRDSTQIVMERDALAGLDAAVDERFTVTVVPVNEEYCRIVGSPVVIKDVTNFLARNGLTVD